jgi:hypothetical protein
MIVGILSNHVSDLDLIPSWKGTAYVNELFLTFLI